MTVRSGQLPWWFGIPFLLGGLVFFGLGVALLSDELRYGQEGVAITGTVVQPVYHPGGGEDGPSYSIRYDYVDPATGVIHGGESDVDEAAFDAAREGDPIEITYLPAEPTKSRIGSPEPQLLIPAVVMGAAALFFSVGAGMLVLTRWIRRNGSPSWLHVSSGSMAGRAPAEGLYPVIANLGAPGAVEEPPPAASPQRPTTAEELRALDARLAPPSEEH